MRTSLPDPAPHSTWTFPARVADPAPPASSLSPAAAQRGELVDRYLEMRPAVMTQMQTDVPEELRAEAGSVTAYQLQALLLLPAEGATMHQLAVQLGSSGPAACTLADRLVGRGLAERRPDASDRRIVRLIPTPRGSQLAARYERAQRAAVTSALECLSDAQMAAFLDAMETIAAATRQQGTPPATVQATGARS